MNIVINNNTNHIFRQSICGREISDTDESENNLNASIMYNNMFTIIVIYRCVNYATDISVCNSYFSLFMLRLTTSGQVFIATEWVA